MSQPELSEERIAGILANRYSWPGADREDVEQEARYAIERCRPKWRPGGKTWPAFAWLCAESHLIELCRRECFRRPLFSELVDRHPSYEDVVERVEARQRLRLILEFPLPPKQRAALNGAFVGKVIGAEARTEHMNRWYAKRKLLTALA